MSTEAKYVDAEVVEERALVSQGAPEALAGRISIARPPKQVLEEAREAAVALREVLAGKPKKLIMNGEQYLEFEDWQTVGKFYGITAKEDGDPEFVRLGEASGFKASALAVHVSGTVLGRATAYCLNDEEKWRSRPKYEWLMCLKSGGTAREEESDRGDWIWEDNPNKSGGKRPKRERVLVGEEPVPLFQLASMAQTRASAKALRNVLAWVVVLAGYRPTPAEELETEEQPQKATTAEPKKKSTKARPSETVSGAQCNELWTRSEDQAEKTGATREVIMRDILAFLDLKTVGDIPAADFDKVTRLIEQWEPQIDFAGMK